MDDPSPAAMAALALCESLMLTLIEKGVISKQEAVDALDDAAQAMEAAASERPPDIQRETVKIARQLQSSIEAAVGR